MKTLFQVMNNKNKPKLVLKDIKDALNNQGFRTTWNDPFMEWLHPEWYVNKKRGTEDYTKLYIYDLPVPKITPFDFTSATVSVGDDCIHFDLTIYYCKVMENVVDGDVYDEHDTNWAPKIATYFEDIAMKYSLAWDIERDEYIEYTLWRSFPIDASDKVLLLMRIVRERYREWENRRIS